MKRFLYNVFLLLLICSISSGLLGIVYERTKEKIEGERKKEVASSKIAVLPGAVRFTEGERFSLGYDKDGGIIGKVVKVCSNGYGGKIEMLVGLNLKEKITGIKIIAHNETPGLGDRITENSFLKQFLQKSLSEIDLRCDGGSIDAITGATVSSRAVVNGIKSIQGLK